MTTAAFITDQHTLLETAIARHARAGERYALLDFPDYANVGDSAIWLGARRILRRLTGRPPVHVSGKWRGGFFGLRARLGAGTIYITGGGNFGDLWPASQHCREKLMARFPDNRIVQLPQSIHFESGDAVRRSAEAIRRHGDFHLMTRDAASEAFARRHFRCPVALAPDCAFGLGTLKPSRDPQIDLHCLMRTDKERLPVDRSPIHALRPRIEDWLSEEAQPIERLKLSILADSILSRGSGRTGLFDRMAQTRLKRGVSLLSSGRQAITDRLHGHILCLLLGVPHVALDNSYGKIEAYCRTWSDGGEAGHFAPDPGAAVAALAKLRKRPWTSPPVSRAA